MAKTNKNSSGIELLQKAAGIKKNTQTALQNFGKGIAEKTKGLIDRRIALQQKFDNRPNNKNYYNFK